MGRVVTGFLSRCSPENKGRIGDRAWLLFSPPHLTATGATRKGPVDGGELDHRTPFQLPDFVTPFQISLQIGHFPKILGTTRTLLPRACR